MAVFRTNRSEERTAGEFGRMTDDEYRAGMRAAEAAYRAYRREGGVEEAHDWFYFWASPELFNEWNRRHAASSYGVSLRGLTRADGVRMTRGFA